MIYGLATMKALGGGELHLNMDDYLRFFEKLLHRQPYIKRLVYCDTPLAEWEAFKVDYDLDLFRQMPFNMGYTILECHRMVFGLDFDITKPWLSNIEPKYIADIVINDTGRSRWEGVTVNWEELRGFEDKAVFVLGLSNQLYRRFKIIFCFCWKAYYKIT